MLETKRPKLDLLSRPFLDQIVSEALDVLDKTGVLVENDEACASWRTRDVPVGSGSSRSSRASLKRRSRPRLGRSTL